MRMAKHVENKLFTIISVAATERAYVIVCGTALSMAELNEGSENGFFPNVWGPFQASNRQESEV